ncbi:ketol-acid reductoisomerase [Fimbriimonas ginsengisoli]|uniref:Ketol-acid reductoisomerase (NADP(+)) n=1 Tax=Fimbriimonas ginsengisoli Gsoil 348 TaxID=661478 RepID=A0A068NJC1_FIMGI|nr:ketol-acid reductoisomerase [Fimbriimonas ginsengisoli]AIE83581.1 ketol-acid reductoisomerase [Fimbriimonas ginsengisoli Gsoil 348]
MATIYYEKDIHPELIKSSKVAVVGYGSQGHAHAQNLRDSGVEVVVALYPGSKSRAKAEGDGFCVMNVPEATDWADVIMFCTPDVPMSKIYNDGVAPRLRDGQLLLFAHGLNIHFGLIEPPKNVDVAMVAPKGPGHRLRAEYVGGAGMPALVAVHQDATGQAKERALAYAWGIGSGKAGVLETTFKEETETDLFGEQAVLCGGLSALIKAGFETLVDAGYQPEAAYFECLHETKLIVDLLYEGGLNYMRYSISDTAEWGDYTAGPKVINSQSREAMNGLLKDIQDGTFAKRWIEENEAGLPNMKRYREEESKHPIEEVGKRLRAMMPFLKTKEVPV